MSVIGEMSDSLGDGLVLTRRVGSIWARLAGYSVQFIVLYIVFILFCMTDEGKDFQNSFAIFHNPYFFLFASTLSISTPFLLVDWLIRRQRRKNGFSVWKDITEEIKQRKVDEQVAREMKAHEKFSEPKSEDKDLDYWFGMLEKGAITKEQYEAKRDELLKS